jgi:DNA-binding MarR family transcriptional regulator
VICKTPVKSNESKVGTLTVGDTGDLTASPGSQPWAIALRLQIQSLLKDNASSVKHLRTCLQEVEEHAGYNQLTDEDGKYFSSYTEFCQAKQPWGLGYTPEGIDRILQDLESVEAKTFEIEEYEGKSWGKLEGYLQRFSKLVERCVDNQSFHGNLVAEVLGIHPNKASVWRKRWLDLGWIQPSEDLRRGYYQITDEGRKFLKKWSENTSSNSHEPLWLTIPRSNSKKAAEQLIKSLEVEQLREIYQLIGEWLGKE